MKTVRIEEFGAHVGEPVRVFGWIHNKRSSGKLQFVILRDGSGYAQAVVSKKAIAPEAWDALEAAGQESSVEIEGAVRADARAPGGFEIDNPDLLSGGDIGGLPWLSPVAAAHTEARDDRFLAAVDWQSQDAFQLAYILRAVTPGRYRHPAPSVEDMYRPAMRAQGSPGEVTVTE